MNNHGTGHQGRNHKLTVFGQYWVIGMPISRLQLQTTQSFPGRNARGSPRYSSHVPEQLVRWGGWIRRLTIAAVAFAIVALPALSADAMTRGIELPGSASAFTDGRPWARHHPLPHRDPGRAARRPRPAADLGTSAEGGREPSGDRRGVPAAGRRCRPARRTASRQRGRAMSGHG